MRVNDPGEAAGGALSGRGLGEEVLVLAEEHSAERCGAIEQRRVVQSGCAILLRRQYIYVAPLQALGDFIANVDVLTAQRDGTTALHDPALLDRATAFGRVLFSQDEDLLAEAAA